MKAHFVLENINFERGKDPFDALDIGYKRIRDIKRNYKFIGPYVESMRADDMDFREFRWKVDSLREVLEYVVINHVNNKYNLNIKPIDRGEMGFNYSSPESLFAKGEGSNYEIELYKNGPGNSFWFILYGGSSQDRSSPSYKLSTFDSKLRKSLKYAGII